MNIPTSSRERQNLNIPIYSGMIEPKNEIERLNREIMITPSGEKRNRLTEKLIKMTLELSDK